MDTKDHYSAIVRNGGQTVRANWFPGQQPFALNANAFINVNSNEESCLCSVSRLRFILGSYIDQTNLRTMLAGDYPSIFLYTGIIK